MQTITEQQTKTIAKEIVKLSKENTLIKHSSVLEIISKSLGYRDYNGLTAAFKKDSSVSVPKPDKHTDSLENNMDNILKSIKSIKEKLEINNSNLSESEISSLEKELTQQRQNYTSAVNRYEASKMVTSDNPFQTTPSGNKITEGKECPNCKGEGGFEVSVQTTVDDMMWYDDGDFYTLINKECFWCSGTGKITNKRIKEVKKMKRESS